MLGVSEQSVGWKGLNPPYSTIVADPPWRYTHQGANQRGDASRKYRVMTVADIAHGLNVLDLINDDAHLWLWTTNAFMEEAHRVVRTWGFSPLTIVTWCKPGPGVGHYLRNNTEHVVLASRGRPLTPETKPLSTWYQWPRGHHSEKPGAFFELVEIVSPGPYVELFARQPRLGWDSWGLGYEGMSDV